MRCIKPVLGIAFALSFLAPAARGDKARLILPPSTSAPVTVKKAKPQVLPKLLVELEERYKTQRTLSAKFSQETLTPLTGQKKKSSGTLLVSRPGKIRWETETPADSRSLLVSDGKTFWFYTPPFEESDNGQLIERKSGRSESKLEQALLSGSFSLAHDMKFEKLSETTFCFTPRKGTAGTVSKATVEIDPKAKTIRKVAIEHLGGNTADISLSEIELGKPIEDSAFHFNAPPKTDRVNE